MKKIITLVTILFSNLVLASNTLELYAESNIYFIPNNDNSQITDIMKMKKHYGGFNELHRKQDDLGGEWNIEIRMNENNVFNIYFWIKDKQQPELNEDLDLSTLASFNRTLKKTADGELRINIIPKRIKAKLEAVELSQDSFGLNHFCFKNSAMIIDDNFYIGKLTGFSERIQIRIPEFYTIDLALKPLNEWGVIGTIDEGVINVDIDENHILTLLNVGVGPSGFTKGGPFHVYGQVTVNSDDRKEYLKVSEEFDFRDSSSRIKSIIMKANEENIYSVAGVTRAFNMNPSEHLLRTVGDFFTEERCGSN